MRARRQSAGVEIHLGRQVVAVLGDTKVTGVRLDDGSEIACDAVLVAIGVVPRTELATAAGLAVDNGIAVDGHLRTSDPAISAAGDCCSFPHPLYAGRRVRLEAWRNAQDQGNHVAARLTGGSEPFHAVPWFWSDQYDLGLQITGLPDTATTTVVRTRADGTEIHFGLGPDGLLLAATGVAPGTGIARDIRIAELLIARQAAPDPAVLADPAVSLKSLLRS